MKFRGQKGQDAVMAFLWLIKPSLIFITTESDTVTFIANTINKCLLVSNLTLHHSRLITEPTIHQPTQATLQLGNRQWEQQTTGEVLPRSRGKKYLYW
jgi:hypothetical protein